MRRTVILCAGLALTVAAGIAGFAAAHGHHAAAPHATHHASAAPQTGVESQPQPSSASSIPAAQPSTSSSSSAASAASTAALAKLPLAQSGTEVYVGVPENITLTDAAGRTVYAQATVDELTQLPATQAHAVLEQLPALSGYQDVYQLPVTLKILGILAPAGTPATSTGGLTAQALSGFTVAVHPGDTPLLSNNTLSTDGCPGAAAARQVAVGQSLSWCVHAFAHAGDPIPTGGQYQAAAGAYSAPLIWASKKFHGGPQIP